MATTLPPTQVPTESGANSGGQGLDFTTIIPQILEKFVAVLEGAVIIAASFFVIRWIRKYLRKIEVTHEQQRNAINLLEKITSGFIVVVAITLALKVVGLDMTLLVSVAILGLSYGLQDIIKNYVAGILILFKAPFKIGETVKIKDYTGRVYKMDFQSTTLETFDHRYITIYNSDVMTQSLVNFSNANIRRLEVDCMLGYGSDTVQALNVFDRILRNHPGVLKNPMYSIAFKKFNETGATFSLKFWVQRPCNILKIRSEIALQLNQAFDEDKIMMPYVKGIEAESDFSMTEKRKARIQAFYQQPLFAEAAQAPATPPAEGQPVAGQATEGQPVEGQSAAEGQVVPELIDIEEPE